MKKTNSTLKKVALGTSIVAAAAAAAGAYFLYGSKDAAKNRKHIKAWSVKAKGDVLEKLESLADVNEEVYHKVIDEVSQQYEKVKNLDASDVQQFASELKGHWKDIAKKVGVSASAKKPHSHKKS